MSNVTIIVLSDTLAIRKIASIGDTSKITALRIERGALGGPDEWEAREILGRAYLCADKGRTYWNLYQAGRFVGETRTEEDAAAWITLVAVGLLAHEAHDLATVAVPGREASTLN